MTEYVDQNSTTFVQPALESDPANNAGNTSGLIVQDSREVLPEKAVVLAPVDNSSKTDELSVALAESKKPLPASVVEKPAPTGKYALDYSLKGVAVHETHATIPHALARIAALARLGITAATSTL